MNTTKERIVELYEKWLFINSLPDSEEYEEQLRDICSDLYTLLDNACKILKLHNGKFLFMDDIDSEPFELEEIN